MKNNSIANEIEGINQSIAYHVKQKAFFENLKDKRQAELDAASARTGRVMSVDDLFADSDNQVCWEVGTSVPYTKACFDNREVRQKIKMGVLFYDKASCQTFINALIVSQERRIDDWKKALETVYE